MTPQQEIQAAYDAISATHFPCIKQYAGNLAAYRVAFDATMDKLDALDLAAYELQIKHDLWECEWCNQWHAFSYECENAPM